MDADGDVPEGVPIEEKKESGNLLEAKEKVIYIDTREEVLRDFYILRKDADPNLGGHGFTRGCAGCSSWITGSSREPHSEACRERFKELLKDYSMICSRSC